MAGTAQGNGRGGYDARQFKIRWDHQAIKTLLESPHGDVAKALLKLALKVQNKAKQLCPVDTGRLRASITHALSVDEEGLVARVGTDVEYAIPIEFGGSKAAPAGFLRPAALSLVGNIGIGPAR